MTSDAGTVLLVGNPNVGKSVIFGALTGQYVTVSNYPGTTVEVTRGRADLGGTRIEVTDTPGVNTLIPQSEDERVTRDILLGEEGTVVQVGEEKNLHRALLLSLQIAEAGRPFLLCLNMGDEAASLGITVDAPALSERLGVDVLQTIATRRQGTSRILPLAARARISRIRITYDARIEAAVAQIEPLLPEVRISRRSLALMLLAGDATLKDWLRRHADEARVSQIEQIRLGVERSFPRSLTWVINEQRLRAARALAEEVTRSRPRRPNRIAETVGAATMHPVWGVPVLVAVLYLMYLFVGAFGAGIAVDFVESRIFGKDAASLTLAAGADGGLRPAAGSAGRERRLRLAEPAIVGGAARLVLEERGEEGAFEASRTWAPVSGERLQVWTDTGDGFAAGSAREIGSGLYRIPVPDGTERVEVRNWSGLINPALYGLFRKFSPWEPLTDFVVGPYGVVTMGLTYAIAIVLPIVTTFFLAFSFLEDSGYLPRLAIMVNKVFRIMGLNGKAVLPMVLGLGCDTMATMTTRILETRKERLIVILLLALGVPCSAQLGVILGMLAALSWKASLLWAGVVSGVIALAGWGASKVIPGRGSDFILEIPPLRWPAPGNILTKTIARIEWYLREAVPLFIIGTVLLFAADRTGALRLVETAFRPFVTGLLGLPAEACEAFIIGFLRRDFGSAGLYRLAEEGLMDPIQVVVGLVTITLFIPCIANFLMIVKEKGAKVALMVGAFVFPFAVLVGGALNFALRALEVRL